MACAISLLFCNINLQWIVCQRTSFINKCFIGLHHVTYRSIATFHETPSHAKPYKITIFKILWLENPRFDNILQKFAHKLRRILVFAYFELWLFCCWISQNLCDGHFALTIEYIPVLALCIPYCGIKMNLIFNCACSTLQVLPFRKWFRAGKWFLKNDCSKSRKFVPVECFKYMGYLDHWLPKFSLQSFVVFVISAKLNFQTSTVSTLMILFQSLRFLHTNAIV